MTEEAPDMFRREIGTTRNFELVEAVRRAHATGNTELTVQTVNEAKSEVEDRIARHQAHIDGLRDLDRAFDEVLREIAVVEGVV